MIERALILFLSRERFQQVLTQYPHIRASLNSQQVLADEFNCLIVAMSIQRDTGGNLAETLANLFRDLVDINIP